MTCYRFTSVASQEQYWRSVLFHNHYSFLSASGYEIDEEGQSRSQREEQELLMKMFAVSVEPSVAPLPVDGVFGGGDENDPEPFFSQLSCKLEREFRCVELAELMTHSVVSLAIRYASRSRRMALAERLSELALEKANQVQEVEEEEPEYSRQTSG